MSGDDGPGGSRSDSPPVFDDAIGIATVVEGDITDYNCTGPVAKKSGASFPSGHASVAAFASAFMFGYCFRRCCNCDKPLGVLVLALVTAAHAVLVCVQRYAQNFHHLVDLGAGVGVGVVVALPFVLWPYGEAPAWLAGGSGQAAPR